MKANPTLALVKITSPQIPVAGLVGVEWKGEAGEAQAEVDIASPALQLARMGTRAEVSKVVCLGGVMEKPA